MRLGSLLLPKISATIYVIDAAGTGNCTYPTAYYPGPPSSTLIYKSGPVPIDGEGDFTLTLPNGLPRGSYCVLAEASYHGNSYTSTPRLFVVQPSPPTPEFSGTAIVVLMALAAALYILRRKH